MTRICFISDTHLDESTIELNALFMDTLSTHVRGSSALYLLGDIFEVWIGDDYNPAWTYPIFDTIKSLSASGTDVYFMAGNRDFLVGSDALIRMGASPLNENSVISIGNHRILLCHGDALCIDDITYQEFRSMVRNPEWQKALLDQPVDVRIALANSLRMQSQAASTVKDASIMDVNQQEVERTLLEHGVTFMIHGHTHRPNVHHFFMNQTSKAACVRVVLGDWRSNEPSWVVLNETGTGELIAHSCTHALQL